ncbi:STN domain-containing protein [Caulobacter sp. RL271]|uniref:STN domain-containing protein n=1 Tax=Caulobacter segnis TaxID=88688 RepID=A0ABY5A1J2_9CAUL|nr:STN domain-containing protein [Caulobacter segnis]USQ98668.1 STN domain-containing protein [Caulobacter segnis]
MSVTIGGVEACKGAGVPLVGTFDLRQALDRATAGKGCVYTLVDAQTVRLSPSRPAAPPRVVAAARAPVASEPIAPSPR